MSDWRETSLGFELTRDGFMYFFGKKEASLANLTAAYPHFSWARVKQTHSDIVVEAVASASDVLVEADAHWTSMKDLGLLISTADCVPMMIADPVRGSCAAVHAGWRGVASRIVYKTMTALVKSGSRAQDLLVLVGPHIQYSSFEVLRDVRDQLLASVANPAVGAFRENGGRFLVDLTSLVEGQILEAGALGAHIARLDYDTKTDLRFHSHRRDRERSGRQLSFIIRV